MTPSEVVAGCSDAVLRMQQRIRKEKIEGHCILIINVDCPIYGDALADILMPEHDWSRFREKGQTPTIRAIIKRQLVINFLSFIDFKAQQILIHSPAQDAVVGISGGAHVFIVQKRGWFNRVLHSLGWAK